jgi:hypothetical protein
VTRRLRLPLLLLLASLTVTLVLLPRPAAAGPVCGSETGQFFDCDDIMAWESYDCWQPGWSEYCKIGWMCWTWDCVQVGGEIVVQNVIQDGPFFCECSPTDRKCC